MVWKEKEEWYKDEIFNYIFYHKLSILNITFQINNVRSVLLLKKL